MLNTDKIEYVDETYFYEVNVGWGIFPPPTLLWVGIFRYYML